MTRIVILLLIVSCFACSSKKPPHLTYDQKIGIYQLQLDSELVGLKPEQQYLRLRQLKENINYQIMRKERLIDADRPDNTQQGLVGVIASKSARTNRINNIQKQIDNLILKRELIDRRMIKLMGEFPQQNLIEEHEPEGLVPKR